MSSPDSSIGKTRELLIALYAEVQGDRVAKNRAVMELYKRLQEQGESMMADLLLTFHAMARGWEEVDEKPNVTITNSTFANVNLGTQVGNINATVEVVGKQGGDAAEFSAALKNLTEAVVSSTEFSPEKKQEILDHLAFLGKEAEKPAAERQTSIMKSVVETVPKLLSAGSSAVSMWHTFGPHILKFLSLG